MQAPRSKALVFDAGGTVVDQRARATEKAKKVPDSAHWQAAGAHCVASP